MLKRVVFNFCCILSLFIFSGLNSANAFNIEVSPFSGTLKIEQVDIYFDGNQQPVEMKRIYRSDSFIGEKFGPGWSHTYHYEVKVREHKNDIVLFGPGDAVTYFKKPNKTDKKNKKSEYISTDGKSKAHLVSHKVVVEIGTNQKLYFDEKGKLKKLIDSKARKVEFVYQKGFLKTVAGLFNTFISFSYDDRALISKVKNNFGEVVEYGFYKDSRLHTVKKNGIKIESYTYNPKGLLESATDRSGHTWHFEYDNSDRVCSISEPSKYVILYRYNETDKLREFTTIAPDGGKSTTRYFKDGLKVVSIDPEGGKTISEFSPESSKLISTTDPNGNITQYKYDKKGRLTEILAPEKQITKISYKNKSSMPSKVKQPDGNILEFTYDDRNNLINHSNDFEGEKDFEYDDFGRVTSMSEFDGSNLKIKYGKSWLPSEIDGDKNTKVKIKYNKNGTPVHMQTGKKLFKFSKLKKRQQQISKRQVSTNNFSQSGKVIKSDDGLTEFTYDAMGNISMIRFPGDGIQKIKQNLNGQISKITGPGKFIEKFNYFPGGQLKSKTYKDGSIQYNYDSANRLQAISYPDGTETSFERNRAGYPILIKHKGIMREIDYDDKGKILSSVYEPDDDSLFENYSKTKVKYKYNDKKDGGLQKTVITNGHDAVYDYDIRGRLLHIDSELFGRIEYKYSKTGLVSEIKYPGNLKETFQVKGNQVTHQILKWSKVLFSEVVTTDKLNRSVSLKTNGNESLFDYDNRGQLLKAETSGKQIRYEYDKWGNRSFFQIGNKATKAAFNKSGQIKKTGDGSYKYDVRGNLAGVNRKKKSLRFKYNISGELDEISSSDNKKVSYRYADNRLMLSRTVGTKTTWIVYDGLNPVIELEKYSPEDSEESIVRRYLPGDSVGEILAMSRLETVKIDDELEIVEKYYYIHSDMRGNVVLITDTDGKIVSTFSYSPFGKLTAAKGKFKPPLLFGAHRYEPLFDLYYMRARFYDPVTGRFLAPDPDKGSLEDSLSTNPYLYVKNSPIDYNDPLGLIRFPTRNKAQTNDSYSRKEHLKTMKNLNNNALKSTVLDSYVGLLTSAVENQTTPKMLPDLSGGFYKKVKIPKPGAEKLGKSMGTFFSVGKVVLSYADLQNQRAKGLIDDYEMKELWKVELVTTTGGVLLDIASAGLKLTGPQTVMLTYLTNKSTEYYKEAVKEGRKWEKAEANRVDSEMVAENTPFVLARKKLTKIKTLIAKGDLKSLNEADRLNDILTTYTEKYASKDSAMDDMYWMTNDFGNKISDKRSVIRGENTVKFEKDWAERHKKNDVAETDSENTQTNDMNSTKPENRNEKEPSDEGGIFFEDVDPDKIAETRHAIESEKYAAGASSDNAISSEAQQMVRKKRQDMQALAAGLSTLTAGLQQAHQQAQAFDAQTNAQIDAQNRQMKNLVDDTIDAQTKTRKAFTDKYGDPYGHTAYSAQGKTIPKRMLPKQTNKSSYGSGSGTRVTKRPKTPLPFSNQSFGKSSTQKKVTKTTLRHYTIIAKKQMKRADGIPVLPGDTLGYFDVLVGYSYGQYKIQKSFKGLKVYLMSSSVASHSRANKLQKDGLADAKYSSERVVLVDGKVIDEDTYKQGTAKMNSIKNKLKKMGLKPSRGSWK